MKKLSMTIGDCRECPHYRRFGQRAAPGCGHFNFRLDAFGVRELPNKNEQDPYNRSTVGVFVGGIPDWCPLEDMTPNNAALTGGEAVPVESTVMRLEEK